MLRIETFDARVGGNVIYKALAHPLAAEGIGRLYARLAEAGPVAIYDPDGIAEALLAMYPDLPGLTALFVHDVTVVGRQRAGMVARALTELPQAEVRTVLIAAFDADRAAARISHLLPAGAGVASLDALGSAGEAIMAAMPPEIVALDITQASQALGSITGEVSSEDVLDAIFREFCIGK
jgi:hypothetical protein